MSALDKLKEQQQASEQSAALEQRLAAVEQSVITLAKNSDQVNKFLNEMDRNQADAMEALETSILQLHDKPSQKQPSSAIETRLSEIEKTLSAVAEQLTAKTVVRLPNDEPVKKSDLESYIMMTNLKETMETTTSSLVELKKVVGNGRTVRVDVEALGKYTVGVLDQRLAKAVEAPVQRIEATLDEFEQRVAEIGSQRVSETTKQVDKTLDKADELIKEIGHAEKRLEALERRVTWTSVSRLCVALLPLAAVLLVVGGLTMGVFHALGFGPLLGWAWGSFAAASTWWAKALIALGTLGGIALFSSVIWWAAKKINDELRTW
ncbi:hypothetical protein AN946_06445 [Trueperella pyogenes]|nr:hypothetical protein AN946_06445 [Trueperella pyogenes]